MQDIDVMISHSNPRDQFAFMLLERIDKLEDVVSQLNGALETALSRLERTETHLLKSLRRKLIEDYRQLRITLGEDAVNDVTYIYGNNYYLRSLKESLDQWSQFANFQPRLSLSDADVFFLMSEYVIGICQGNQEVILEVGRYFSSMGVDDLEAFIKWDTMPDLA